MVLVVNCYERIINNYLEVVYLNFMALHNDSDVIINAVYKAMEKAFITTLKNNNYLTFRHKLLENINELLKPHNKNNITNNYSIDERIYLFNFNISKYFNELDNMIIIYILINGYEVNKVALLLNNNEEYILERFYSIVNWMRVYFNTVIKQSINKK